MFFIHFANGPGESSLLSSLGPAASITTLLCVIVVTIALMLLTLMCICSKQAASVKLQNDSAPLAESENQVSFRELLKAEDVESQLTEANTEETYDGELTKAASENCTPANSVLQLAKLHVKEETRPTSHPSPFLPPRNPHNFHPSGHPTNQPSTSVQASSGASAPNSVEKIHEACTTYQKNVASSAATENATAKSDLPEHSLPNCTVQPDYEEVNLPEPSAKTEVEECDDSNIYQDIDLNQESKSRKTRNSDTIEPYAEYKEDKKSSYVEQRQSKTTSLATSEAEVPTGSQTTKEIPRYAKVDRSKKSHVVTSDSPLANHLPADGLVSEEVASSSGEPRSSEPSAAVAELYTQVHKPNRNVVSCEPGKDLHDYKPREGSHVSEAPEGARCGNSIVANGEMVLNPCYATTMMHNYPGSTASGHAAAGRSEVQVVEEPGYSTVDEEHVDAAANVDPGYSSIYEERHVYSEISAANSHGRDGLEGAASATGDNSTVRCRSAKEPIYEMVDATPRDEASNPKQ